MCGSVCLLFSRDILAFCSFVQGKLLAQQHKDREKAAAHFEEKQKDFWERQQEILQQQKEAEEAYFAKQQVP